MREEFLDPKLENPIEESDEAGLRPKHLEEFVGQRELKEKLGIVLEAARRRGEAVDHLLFAGPPGLGKTTLSGIIAAEMGVRLHITSAKTSKRCSAFRLATRSRPSRLSSPLMESGPHSPWRSCRRIRRRRSSTSSPRRTLAR